jgi:K+-sensing histidine kinase KdpD
LRRLAQGIPDLVKDKILIFYTVNSKDVFESTGVLAICSKIIKWYGGTIEYVYAKSAQFLNLIGLKQ